MQEGDGAGVEPLHRTDVDAGIGTDRPVASVSRSGSSAARWISTGLGWSAAGGECATSRRRGRPPCRRRRRRQFGPLTQGGGYSSSPPKNARRLAQANGVVDVAGQASNHASGRQGGALGAVANWQRSAASPACRKRGSSVNSGRGRSAHRSQLADQYDGLDPSRSWRSRYQRVGGGLFVEAATPVLAPAPSGVQDRQQANA